jgi:D-glycerate 3-kinase
MTGVPVQEFRSASAIEPWLSENTRLSAKSRSSLAGTVLSLISRLSMDRIASIGISGAPGSGKSTLSRALVFCLNTEGIPACRLTLDDYYFRRAERARLARETHPLFQQRGVPGTHDLGKLLTDFDRLRKGAIEDLRLPVFDKSVDDRAGAGRFRRPDTVPQIIVVEGWCVGAMPQAQTELTTAINEFERIKDPDSRWREQVHHAWHVMYDALRKRLEQVWYIRVPDWECVVDWRWQQEQELVHKNLHSRQDVADFLARFERIARHMQVSYPQWADLVIEAGREHDFRLPDQDRI